jgi:hypothetical protein
MPLHPGGADVSPCGPDEGGGDVVSRDDAGVAEGLAGAAEGLAGRHGIGRGAGPAPDRGLDQAPDQAPDQVAEETSTPAEETSPSGDEDAPPRRPDAPPPVPRSMPAHSRTAARLAHVHLRLGMFGLARAELETLAARGTLDVPALADLAEVRWRTGDLVGAGEAAEVHLRAGGDDLVSMCVAAEAAAAAGRTADARTLAARVLARGRDRLDELFAGQPRSNIWPPEPSPPQPEAGAAGTGRDQLPTPAAPSPMLAASASSDLADVQARVARGDLASTATRLALVLRSRPALAPAVLAVADEALAAVGTGPDAAPLHVVRGDAYRLMGRERLATEAFEAASRALRARPSEEPT